MVEGGNLLDRDLPPSWAMDGRTYDTVGTLSYNIEDLILRACEGTMRENGRMEGNKHGPTLNLTLRGAGCVWEAACPCFEGCLVAAALVCWLCCWGCCSVGIGEGGEDRGREEERIGEE